MKEKTAILQTMQFSLNVFREKVEIFWKLRVYGKYWWLDKTIEHRDKEL